MNIWVFDFLRVSRPLKMKEKGARHYKMLLLERVKKRVEPFCPLDEKDSRSIKCAAHESLLGSFHALAYTRLSIWYVPPKPWCTWKVAKFLKCRFCTRLSLSLRLTSFVRAKESFGWRSKHLFYTKSISVWCSSILTSFFSFCYSCAFYSFAMNYWTKSVLYCGSFALFSSGIS